MNLYTFIYYGDRSSVRVRYHTANRFQGSYTYTALYTDSYKENRDRLRHEKPRKSKYLGIQISRYVVEVADKVS